MGEITDAVHVALCSVRASRHTRRSNGTELFSVMMSARGRRTGAVISSQRFSEDGDLRPVIELRQSFGDRPAAVAVPAAPHPREARVGKEFLEETVIEQQLVVAIV